MPQHSETMVELPAAVAALCEAMTTRELLPLEKHLADDVVFISPLTDRFSFEGTAGVLGILGAAADAFQDLRYTAVEVSGSTAVLRAEAVVRGTAVEEVVWLSLDHAGAIAELTVFLRPFAGAAAVLRAVPPVVARRERGALTAFGAERLGGLLRCGARIADAAGAGVMQDSPGVRQAPAAGPGHGRS